MMTSLTFTTLFFLQFLWLPLPAQTPVGTATAKQCYGPDYKDLDVPPQIFLSKNLCINAILNQSGQESHHIQVSLSYGTLHKPTQLSRLSHPQTSTKNSPLGEATAGTEYMSETDPSFTEKLICQPFNDCTLCLGFVDAFISDNWARICPKFESSCPSQKIFKNTYDDCLYLGDG